MRHLWWLASTVAAACSYTEQVDVSDSTAFLPVARVRIDRGLWFGPAPDAPRPDGSEPRSYVQGELSATMATGDLSVAEPVGNIGDYDMRDFAMLARVGRSDGMLDGAILVGLEFGEVDGELRGPTTNRDLGAAWFGLAFGLEGGVTPVESLRTYVRLQPFVGIPSARIMQAELGVEWTIVDPVRLIGGYRYWDLHAEGINIGFGSTTVDLTLTGPFAGIVLQF
jgi:hypothetical protein